MIVTDTQTPLSQTAQLLGLNVMRTLCKHYPHVAAGWHVTLNTEGGTLVVQNLLLSGKMGFTMRITDLDAEGREIVRAGGELLERYRVARDRAIDVREMLAAAPRHRSGEMVAQV
jgi:hypothetical protein